MSWWFRNSTQFFHLIHLLCYNSFWGFDFFFFCFCFFFFCFLMKWERFWGIVAVKSWCCFWRCVCSIRISDSVGLSMRKVWRIFLLMCFLQFAGSSTTCFFRFLSISSFSQTLVTGLALLRFKEGILSDPFGALVTWNDDVGVLNPCFWNRIQCDNGNVVSL